MSRSLQDAKPMIGPSKTERIFQGRNVTRHCDVKCIIAFSRCEDLHYDFIRARKRTHSLALPHFMSPEFFEICIDSSTRLLPVFENDRVIGATIDRADDGGLQCGSVGRRQKCFLEHKTLRKGIRLSFPVSWRHRSSPPFGRRRI